MIKIYFACSIRGGRNDAKLYKELVEHIKKKATVLSEIFADGTLTAQGSEGTNSYIYHRDMRWLNNADAVIAEVTNPSLGVGYEIAMAETSGKPILALFHADGTKNLSAIIGGSPKLHLINYQSVDEAYVAINTFLQTVPTK
jgi:2'-deoxynucleoside 5'-phosphate N-hydrolase